MKAITIGLIILGTGLEGCSTYTYHEDYSILVDSEPPAAEIWKEGYFLGFTPYVLHYTETWEDKERGYIRIPTLLIKKENYVDKTLDLDLNLEEGRNWECRVELDSANN